jgi:hypothetical protein
MKEGVHYKIRIDFHVQREIVQGLKYVQKTYRKGIQGMLTIFYSSFRCCYIDDCETGFSLSFGKPCIIDSL